MNGDQYHLCKIAEEASEVAKRALKAQQFGLGEIQPGKTEDNLARLVSEFHDLSITFDNFLCLIEKDISPVPTEELRTKRLAKMSKFLELSKELNQVDEDTTI